MKDLKAWDVGGSKKFELMHATPKLFVERKSNDFHLARGYYIGFGLALVKVQYEAGSDGGYPHEDGRRHPWRCVFVH